MWWPYDTSSVRTSVCKVPVGGTGTWLACKQVCQGHHMAVLGNSRDVNRHAHVTSWQFGDTAGMQNYTQPSNYWHWDMAGA